MFRLLFIIHYFIFLLLLFTLLFHYILKLLLHLALTMLLSHTGTLTLLLLDLLFTILFLLTLLHLLLILRRLLRLLLLTHLYILGHTLYDLRLYHLSRADYLLSRLLWRPTPLLRLFVRLPYILSLFHWLIVFWRWLSKPVWALFQYLLRILH